MMPATFVLGVVGLLALAVWLLRPAWCPPRATAAARPAHIAVLAEQLEALDRERANGEIDAHRHGAARTELQRRLLDETPADAGLAIDARPLRGALLGVLAALPLFAIALYAAIGNPAGLTVRPDAASRAEAGGEASIEASIEAGAEASAGAEAEVAPEAMEALLATLAKRLDTPSGDAARDLQGWTMLARAYASLQRFADADRAYARATALAPGDPQLLADRADVLAVLAGGRTAGEPDRLIAEALRLDPRNLKALALAGSAAYERQDFITARRQWQQARDLAPPGSAFAAGLDRSLSEIGAMTGVATVASRLPASPAPAPTVAAAPARITGRVTLAPALAARAAPGDTVFVFARAAEGPRMPLAIVRRTVADLPFDFTLDDSSAMSPQTRLSSAGRVTVGVRVSRSGSATPQTGDLRGDSAVVGTRTDGVTVVIEGVQP